MVTVCIDGPPSPTVFMAKPTLSFVAALALLCSSPVQAQQPSDPVTRFLNGLFGNDPAPAQAPAPAVAKPATAAPAPTAKPTGGVKPAQGATAQPKPQALDGHALAELEKVFGCRW